MSNQLTRELERFHKVNPWVLVNLQNSQALSGRYPTKEKAIEAAEGRGGVVSVEGYTVFFSEMPRL